MYKIENTLEFRKNESSKILEKYKDRIPVIVEKSNNCEYTLDKNKFLVSKELSMHQLVYIIRKRIKLKDHETIFIYVANKLVPSNSLLSEIYNTNKDEDGFLYLVYSSENTFG